MTKQIITQAELKEQLHYNPDTGIFTWIKNSRRINAGAIAGSLTIKGYINIVVNGRCFKAHRLAWLYIYGEIPKEQIDHVDMNKSKNNICNLRLAYRSINQQNMRNARKDNNSSKYLGVSKRKNCDDYRADIRVNGKKLYLGIFKNQELAHEAYLNAKRQFHEGCTI